MTLIECSICYENISQENLYFTECAHSFCNNCFQKWKECCEGDITCPNCRFVIEKKIQHESFIEDFVSYYEEMNERNEYNMEDGESDDEEDDMEEEENEDEDEDEESEEFYYQPISSYRKEYKTEREYLQDLRDYRELMAYINNRV